MMIFFRSLVFNMFFFGWTILCTTIAFLFVLFGRKPLIYTARIWGYGVQTLLKFIVGITYEIQGKENLPKTSAYIFACKHQSAWETTMIQLLSFDAAIILKRELLWIPLFGQVLTVSGAIGIDRRKGKRIIPHLIADAQKQVQKGRPIFIFPEGTRGQPGKPGVYKLGVYTLYQRLQIPVVPAALNSGYFWPRRGFLKYPGHIVIKILPPIQPGLKSDIFMQQLQETIESACQNLVTLPYHEPKTGLEANYEHLS